MNSPDTNDHEDYVNFPESALHDRIKTAYDWIPEGCQNLLDGGCAFGYGTRFLKKKSVRAWGVDPNPKFITIAKNRYPDITFCVSSVEQMPFELASFDVIILNDVLEHVINEKSALDEAYRVLVPGGTFIITTPHKGLFSFMDPDNYSFHLRTHFPRLYRWLYRAKHGVVPSIQIKPGYEQKHRHYNLGDFVRLLNNSNFKGRFEIDAVFRSGLFLGVFAQNAYEILSMLFGMKSAAYLGKPLRWLADKEYLIPFGPLAYNIAIRVKKLK